MGSYILIAFLACWSAAAFSIGDVLINDAVDAYGHADPVYGNLPLHLIWLTLAALIAFPRIVLDAIIHFFTITLRR